MAIASKTDILTPLQTALEDSQLPYTFDLEDGIEKKSDRLIRAYQMSDVSWLAMSRSVFLLSQNKADV